MQIQCVTLRTLWHIIHSLVGLLGTCSVKAKCPKFCLDPRFSLRFPSFFLHIFFPKNLFFCFPLTQGPYRRMSRIQESYRHAQGDNAYGIYSFIRDVSFLLRNPVVLLWKNCLLTQIPDGQENSYFMTIYFDFRLDGRWFYDSEWGTAKKLKGHQVTSVRSN